MTLASGYFSAFIRCVAAGSKEKVVQPWSKVTKILLLLEQFFAQVNSMINTFYFTSCSFTVSILVVIYFISITTKDTPVEYSKEIDDIEIRILAFYSFSQKRDREMIGVDVPIKQPPNLTLISKTINNNHCSFWVCLKISARRFILMLTTSHNEIKNFLGIFYIYSKRIIKIRKNIEFQILVPWKLMHLWQRNVSEEREKKQQERLFLEYWNISLPISYVNRSSVFKTSKAWKSGVTEVSRLLLEIVQIALFLKTL